MALLEPAYWHSKELPFSIKQVVSAPEFSGPTTNTTVGGSRHCYSSSPTPTPNPSACTLVSPTSQDSGFDSPWSPSHSITSESSIDAFTTNPNFQSPRHLLAAAGTGFSLGVIMCDKGTLHQLSVPIPAQMLESDPPLIDITAFTRTDITTIALVGDSQIWAGTSLGTLHCMELVPDLQRLKNHSFITINESVLCICSRPLEHIFPSISQPSSSIQSSMTTEVLIGVPFGYMIVLAGEADPKGHLKKSVDKLSSRRIIRFTNSPVDCAVNCIAHVYSDTEGECYWCGCGGNLYIVRSSDWKKIYQLDARIDKLTTDPLQVEVAHLQVTDAGVWSYLSKSSSITLWDRTNFSVKLHLNYCNSRRSLSLRPETSCLYYSYPFLFIGTEQGDLMIFQINEKCSLTAIPVEEESNPASDTGSSTSKHEYTYISSTHVGPNPIVSIQATTTHSTRCHNVLSSTPSPKPSSVVNIFVLERPTNLCDKSHAHVFELCLTPPHSVRSSPLSDITILSASSLRNNSLTPRKLSVFSATYDFLPLKSND